MKLPYLLILLATAFWGSTGIAAEKLFASGLGPAEVIWFRVLICLIAALFYGGVANRRLLKINRQDMTFFGLYGLVSVAMFYFAYFNAIAKSGIAVAAILMYTAPAMVIMLSYFMLNEGISRVKILCIVLTLMGCFLVVKGYDLSNVKLNLAGILWGLFSGFCYAMFTILGKQSAGKYHPLTLMLYGQGAGLIYLTVFAFPLKMFTVKFQPQVWYYLVYIGLAATFIPNLCYNTALKYLESGQASIAATLEPVMAVGFAYLFLGHILEPVQLLGALLVLMAVLIVQVPANLYRDLRVRT